LLFGSSQERPSPKFLIVEILINDFEKITLDGRAEILGPLRSQLRSD
jgi:hypothetical protein